MKRHCWKSRAGADPVAGVGGDQHPAQGRRRLAGHQGVAHPGPHCGRAQLQERPGHEAELDGRVVADLLAGREERRDAPGLRPGQPWSRDQAVGQVELGRADAQGGGPHHLGLPGQQAGLDQLDAAPAPQQAGGHRQLGHGRRPQDLEGDPGDLEPGPVGVALHRPAEQCRRRPGVLEPRAPGPLGQLRRLEPVRAERKEEGLGHAGSLDAPISVWRRPTGHGTFRRSGTDHPRRDVWADA